MLPFKRNVYRNGVVRIVSFSLNPSFRYIAGFVISVFLLSGFVINELVISKVNCIWTRTHSHSFPSSACRRRSGGEVRRRRHPGRVTGPGRHGDQCGCWTRPWSPCATSLPARAASCAWSRAAPLPTPFLGSASRTRGPPSTLMGDRWWVK